MDKKEAGTVFDANISSYDVEKLGASPKYKKGLNVFESHEREIRVRNVITDLEAMQFRSKLSRTRILILITYLMAIIAAEIVTAHYSVGYGLAMHNLILIALLINSSITDSSGFANLLRSMMILPMIRIIGLSIPMQVPQLYWFPVIAVPFLAASFTLMRTQKFTRKKVGLTLGNIPVQLVIALSGVILGFTEYLILKPQPLISSFTIETVLFGGIILLISTGFAEELLFRGILQTNAEKVLGSISGLIYTSILFTALHIGWNSILDLVFVFCVAIFYGYAFQRTKSLFGITLSHGISNTFLFLIVPFIFPGIIPYINYIISWIMHV